jgi:hypothetical protein
MVFLGKVNRFDRDIQLNYCQQIVGKHEFPEIGDSIYEHNEVGKFIDRMRGNEVAIVPFLSGLATTKTGRGITREYYINLMKLYKECQFIISFDTTKRMCIEKLITARSDCGSEWWNLVGKTGDSVSHGRKLSTREAKKRNQIKVEKAKPGLVRKWQLKEGDGEYIAAAMVWGNLSIKPAKRAITLFADEELKMASKETVQRIFGSRQCCERWLNENI